MIVARFIDHRTCAPGAVPACTPAAHHPMAAYPGRIIFDHFAKTGGQAINAWLVGALGTACVTPNIISEHQRAIRELGGRYSIITGHISFSPGDRLDPRYRYLTVLREPVDRVLSWIFYLLHHVDPAGMSQALVEAARRFVESDGTECAPELRDSVGNLVVEHFAGLGDTAADTDARKLARALEALRRYEIVGRYDRLADFTARVAALIGIAAPSELPATNVTRERPRAGAITSALRERIEALCPLDLALYRSLVNGDPLGKAPWASRAPRAGTTWEKYDRVARDRIEPGIALSLASGPPGERAQVGQRVEFVVDIVLARAVDDLVPGIHIHDGYGNWAFGTNTQLQGQQHVRLRPGRYRVTFSVVAALPIGRYTVGFGVNDHRSDGVLPLLWYDEICQFEVTPAPREPFAGYSYLQPQVSLERVASA